MQRILGPVRTDGWGDIQVVLPGGVAPPANVPADMFTAAVDAYLAGHRLDMQSLARHLGVGRATLYRRVGNREQLLDQLIWWRGRRMVASQVLMTVQLRGAPRIAAVVAGALRAIERDRPLRALIEAEPDVALRILTGNRSVAGHGMATALASLIELERSRGAFDADVDAPTLAFAIMRISEGFLYADVIGDRAPDVGQAITVIRALLVGLNRQA
jgi:AcrR family transcriptional regulator